MFVRLTMALFLSLAGVATSIIFVATKVLSRQTRLLSRQKYKKNCRKYVATNTCLWRQKFCRDKHAFVATKDVLCRDKHVFVATKMIFVAAPANYIFRPFKEDHLELPISAPLSSIEQSSSTHTMPTCIFHCLYCPSCLSCRCMSLERHV